MKIQLNKYNLVGEGPNTEYSIKTKRKNVTYVFTPLHHHCRLYIVQFSPHLQSLDDLF